MTVAGIITKPMAAREAPPAIRFSVLLNLGRALLEEWISVRSTPLIFLRASSVRDSFRTVKYMAAPGTFLFVFRR